ncbi:hypothetical protein HK102_010818, partial [Quaeritorhiza haematococci]
MDVAAGKHTGPTSHTIKEEISEDGDGSQPPPELFEEEPVETSEAYAQTNKIAEADEGWLTDCSDVDEIPFKRKPIDPYTQKCKVLGVVPVTYISKRLKDATITMKHRGLGPRGAEAVAEILEKNPTLTHLDLTNNACQAGAACLGKALNNNRALTHLNLSSNQLVSECGKELADMLKENKTLKTLILRGNRLSDREVKHFANSLMTNSTLAVLDLSYNDIGDVGVVALGSSLSKNDG